MSLFDDYQRFETRRQFFARGKNALGYAALGSLLGPAMRLWGDEATKATLPHFPARAKNIIYLFMAGGPSQLELFDHKPQLQRHRGRDLPESVRQGQRLTAMTSGHARSRCSPSTSSHAHQPSTTAEPRSTR